MSLTDIGNSFSYVGFNLPTVDRSQSLVEFPTMFHLMDFLKANGDQNAAIVKRSSKNPESFIAAAAIYQTLFNKLTIPLNEDSMLFDECVNDLDFLKHDEEDYFKKPYDVIRKKYNFLEKHNVLSTFEYIFLVGWKYHEDQQKPKSPKMSNLSFREIVDEIETKEDNAYIRFGTLSDDMAPEDVDKVAEAINNRPK